MEDNLGDRMKLQYEMRSKTYLQRRTYTIIRLDGKAFHTFTKGMKRPYDKNFMKWMDETTKFLCKEIQGCQLAYTQSDEISLLLTDFENITTDAWFDGQVQKIVSVSASLATGKFNRLRALDVMQIGTCERALARARTSSNYEFFIMHSLSDMTLAFFDARVFTIPDPVEVENYFIWRQKDAIRNSISMHAQSLYSHKQLHGKSQKDMHDMIHDKGENWNDLPDGFKRGRTFYKDVVKYDKDNIVEKVDWTLHTTDFQKVEGDDFKREISYLIPKIKY